MQRVILSGLLVVGLISMQLNLQVKHQLNKQRLCDPT